MRNKSPKTFLPVVDESIQQNSLNRKAPRVTDKSLRNVYQDELARFKSNETPESVLLIDNRLLRFLVAWQHLKIRQKKPLISMVSRDEEDIWQWLWKNAEFSLEQFAAMAGVPMKEATEKLNLLSGNKMIYPDGAMNSYVENLLKAKVVSLFKKAQAQHIKSVSPT